MYIKQWRYRVNLNHRAVLLVCRCAKSSAINHHRFIYLSVVGNLRTQLNDFVFLFEKQVTKHIAIFQIFLQKRLKKKVGEA